MDIDGRSEAERRRSISPLSSALLLPGLSRQVRVGRPDAGEDLAARLPDDLRPLWLGQELRKLDKPNSRKLG